MIKDIFRSALNNLQAFLVAWIIIIIANQLFIFGACFAPYCLIAALPHTFVIALLINHFIISDTNNNSEKEKSKKNSDNYSFTQPKEVIQDHEFEETQIPFCPKCGSTMVLRTAKKGRYAGNNFWGCSAYPKCKGLLNI